MRESDTVARLAGDEFVILAPGLRTVDDAAQLAQKLIDRFAQPLAIPGHHIVSRLSVGVTLYPLDESDGESLLRHADMRSEEHTSELQSLMRIPYAVFCLKKKKRKNHHTTSILKTEKKKTTTNKRDTQTNHKLLQTS